MNLRRLLLTLCCAALLGGLAVTARADMALEAALSHLSFTVDQGTILTITVNGASRLTDIELPEVAGLNFQNRGQSSRVNIVNGEMSSSLAQSYLVRAQRPGTYTIPPIKVTAGGESGTTRPLSFEVTAGGGSASSSTGTSTDHDQVAFLRLEVAGDHYPGEIVPVRIKAYFHQRYKTEINSLPQLKGEGVAMPQLKDKPVQSEERINGIAYHVLSWDTTLAGLKVGRHSLSLTMEASLMLPQRRRPLSPFGGGLFDDSLLNDPFFDNFFGGMQRKPIELRSPEIVFPVIPIPEEGRPKDFHGAIGDFSLRVSGDRPQLEVGEPLKLSMEISGQGNFERLEPPVFPESPVWKTYPPASSFVADGNSYSGSKTFEMAVVAREAGVKEIPELSFSFFNPDSKSYVTVRSPPLTIEVKQSSAQAPNPSPQAPPPPPTPAPETPPAGGQVTPATGLAAHLAPIRLELGPLSPTILPIFARGWYLGLAGVGLALLLLAGLLELRRRLAARHPEKAERRHRDQLLALDLRRCREALDGGDGRAFVAWAKSAAQHRLASAWKLPAEAITRATVEERLGRQSSLLAIFTAADAADYGGSTLSREEMEQLLATLHSALEELP